VRIDVRLSLLLFLGTCIEIDMLPMVLLGVMLACY